MKKTFQLLFIILFSLSIFSCGDDDEMSELDGSWTALSSEFDVTTTSTTNGNEFSSQSTGNTTAIDYDLVFTGSSFTTSGSYTYDVNTSVDGAVVSSGLNPVSDVSGAGTYTVDGSVITINGSLFELSFNGQSLAAANGPQTAEFTINGDILTFNQNEVITSDQNGVTSTSTIISTSVWERQ